MRFRDMFSFFSVRHQRMAKLTEENPEVTPAIRNIAEGLLRIQEEEGIDLNNCKFRVNIISGRRLMLTIMTPQDVFESNKKRRSAA